ncbi:hypothetical protein GCM10023231_00990 [Olivibacter ginsenosidimutans]|uniref:Glucose/Sorbosone dehydrogenase domain-containing protein n=1 Tax=Olivibacter ginsenosidimutans TaxID=1176537 RepID=A0ABP9AC70_9SPHI
MGNVCCTIALVLAGFMTQVDGQTLPKFTKRILAKGLDNPWTIIYGPDHFLWITEAKGYRVLHMDPETGKVDTLLNATDMRNFPRYGSLKQGKDKDKPWPQGGMMGMALHPGLMKGEPFVFLAFIYDFEGKDREGDGHHPQDGGFYFKTKLVRFTYDAVAHRLQDPQTICDTIPQSNDHNGGRMLLAEMHGKSFLFYSVGDMGAGQFKNAGRPNHAQDPHVYEGKILRFNTAPDGDRDEGDAWVPNDNPFNTKNAQSAVWTIGHRNPQGLAKLTIHGKQLIYAAEHGPFSDDELNSIQKGKNYGHPLIIGYPDGNYNGLAAGVTDSSELPGYWNSTYPLIKNEQKMATTLNDYKPPMFSFYPTANDTLRNILASIRAGKSRDWVSLAPSGIDVYSYDAIPGWKNSLLVASLKQGKIIQLKLNDAGDRVLARHDYFKAEARYRAIAVSSDGTKIFAVTDNAEVTSGPSAEHHEAVDEKGAVIEWTYTP